MAAVIGSVIDADLLLAVAGPVADEVDACIARGLLLGSGDHLTFRHELAREAILNALANTACGASWVSVHHGGGVGMGYSIHAGQVIVADGTPEAARRLERVLTADPALGVMRHADAGYDLAKEVAAAKDVDLAGAK